MKNFVLLILGLCLSAYGANPSLPCAVPCLYGPQPISHNGIARYYAAYFPASITASTPYPLIVVLNGANIVSYNNPKLNAQQTLQSFADANNVAILWILSAVYDTGAAPGTEPEPYQNCISSTDACQWVWRLPFYFTTYYTDYDDFGYITDRITNAERAWGADSSRILLIGGSTGGMEAHAYAQANPGNVLAIGTFAGPLWAQNGFATPPPPVGNVNVFIAHGDADPTLPYCGGATSDPWYGLTSIFSASADETFNYWTGSSGMTCSSITPASDLCPTSGGIFQKAASGCREARRAMFIRALGADHQTVANYEYPLLVQFWNFVFPPTGQPTSIALLSAVNPSVASQAVPMTAFVSSTMGTPTGTVTFVKNGLPFAAATLSAGQATTVWTFGWAGTKSISAFYSGDSKFASSNSQPLMQQVNLATTATSVSSSANPSDVGQAVTFTATVSSQTGGMPTGNVTFSKNGWTIATVPVLNGRASYTQALSTAGLKNIIATYSGDAANASSTSPVLIQIVTAPQ